EVFIIAKREPMRRRLDARPFERSALDDIDGNVEFPECSLDARQVYLAIALRTMGIARPQQRALHEHRQIKGRSHPQLAQTEMAAVTSWGNSAVAARFGACDTKDTGKRAQRNENTGQELSNFVVPVEIDVADSPFRKLLRKLSGEAGVIHIHPVRARYDLVDLHLEHIARLGTFDIDGPSQRVCAAARHLLANLGEHVQGRAGHEAIVEMHHGFHDDGIARLDGEYRLLCIVVPAQLRGLHRRRKEMNFSRSSGSDRHRLRGCLIMQKRKQRAGEEGQRYLGLGLHFTLPCFLNRARRTHARGSSAADLTTRYIPSQTPSLETDSVGKSHRAPTPGPDTVVAWHSCSCR